MKKIFQTPLSILMAALFATSFSTIADEKEQHVVIKIEKSTENSRDVELKLDGQVESFSLPELADGDSKTLQTQSGKNITINQSNGEYQISIDGETISIPAIGADLSARIQRTAPLIEKLSDSVNISGVKLDENQQQIIRDAFRAAGINKPINFSDKQLVFISKEIMTGDLSDAKNTKLLKSGEHEDVKVFIKKLDKHEQVIIDSEQTVIKKD
ncbi:hypothetical protein [Aliikangiella maris]|uniref:Uncharacterized protein n=2 Tax=Aliikangiella maris TaxID=3162458 RepID=A0ABV2BUJ5_9GAMM